MLDCEQQTNLSDLPMGSFRAARKTGTGTRPPSVLGVLRTRLDGSQYPVSSEERDATENLSKKPDTCARVTGGFSGSGAGSERGRWRERRAGDWQAIGSDGGSALSHLLSPALLAVEVPVRLRAGAQADGGMSDGNRGHCEGDDIEVVMLERG